MELGPLQTQWVEALESGEYQQGKGFLGTPGDPNRYCCLGVLCTIHSDNIEISQLKEYITFDGQKIFLPPVLSDKLAFWGADGAMNYTEDMPDKIIDLLDEYGFLSDINDSGKFSFKQIAEFVRMCPGAFFKESR